MRLGRFLLQGMTVIFLLVLAGNARFNASVHQAKPPKPGCPVLKLSCPDVVNAGTALVFEVRVNGGDPKVTPTFNWSVSSGSIESGQGTAKVVVDTTALSDGETVTATVEASGFDRECPTYASCTSSVMKKPEARKLDEYTALKPKDEQARLDTFAMELLGEPLTQGYIIAYTAASSRAGEKAADKAKDYLANKRDIEPARLVTVAGGPREQATIELWIVPSGAEPPKATPTVDPTKAKPASPTKPKKP